MKRFCIFSILILCFLFSINISFAQKSKTKTQPVKQTKVDLGILRQNTYTNDLFELKLEFPFGWLVGDNMLESQLMEIQKQSLSPKVKQLMNRLTPLLGGYRALPGSKAENSNLKIVVESVTAVPKIKTGKDYLSIIKTTINATQMPTGFTVSDIKNEMIDGKSIDYLETKYGANHKRSYVMVKKGFAVLITIDSYNQSDFDELHKVLTEADLDYKKTN
ncbi:MAG: hypothetical protein AAB336_01900 [Acidobacteriota bacterium]